MARKLGSTYIKKTRKLSNLKKITTTLQSLIHIANQDDNLDAIILAKEKTQYIVKLISIDEYKLKYNEIFLYIQLFANEKKYDTNELLEILDDNEGPLQYVNVVFKNRLIELIGKCEQANNNIFFEHTQDIAIQMIQQYVIKNDSRDKLLAKRIYSYLFNRVHMIDVNYSDIYLYEKFDETIQEVNIDRNIINKNINKEMQVKQNLHNKYDVLFSDIEDYVMSLELYIHEIYLDYKYEVEELANEICDRFNNNIAKLEQEEKYKDKEQTLYEVYVPGSGGILEEKEYLTNQFNEELLDMIEEQYENFLDQIQVRLSKHIENFYMLIKAVLINHYKVAKKHISSKNKLFKTTLKKEMDDLEVMYEILYLDNLLLKTNNLFDISKYRNHCDGLYVDTVINGFIEQIYLDDLIANNDPEVYLSDISKIQTKHDISLIVKYFRFKIDYLKKFIDNISYSDIEMILFYAYKSLDSFIFLYILVFNEVLYKYTNEKIITTLHDNLEYIKSNKHSLTQKRINNLFK
jgi:hypothetical protein